MRDWIDNQYQNLFMYVPFLMAGGGALYFAMENEPNLKFAPMVLAMIVGTLFIKRIPTLLRAALIFLFGLYYACVFTDAINTPQIKSNKHNIDVTGIVDNIDFTDTKTRIYLRIAATDINAGNGDAVVRVSVDNDKITMPQIGDKVQANIGLFKPTPAYAPEAFDYARWAYFNNLTATGYINTIDVIETHRVGNTDKLRNRIHNRMNSFLVDSLVLGYKNAVPKDDSPVWTATGIGHVWSISGFHLTLVGGWLFLIFYFLFRSIPYITRRIPAKIPAMGCAWAGLIGYLFLSGTDVATIRAFIMTTMVFLAFAFGRSAISMRNIAIAFCVIFLLNPHYVMQAGFQLSFAAVFGLVWVYNDIKPKMPRNKILKIIYACVITSVVATIFTAPFVAMHFGTIPVYGLIGNLVLLPIFSFAIMPLIMTGTVFCIQAPIDLAHRLYESTLQIANLIADMPAATINIPYITNAAILCFIAGFIALILIRPIKVKINYLLFCAFCAIGIGIVATTPKPKFFATYDNELVAFVEEDGKLSFNKSKASNHYFAFNTWKGINGEAEDTPNRRRKHNNGIYRFDDIVYIQKFIPLMNNIQSLCNDDTVRYIVSYFDVQSNSCNHKLLRGGFVIWDNGQIKFITTKRRWH